MARILTQEGLKKLQDELEDRKIRVRQEIAAAIKEAKEQGDLSENAEYSEAKHQQNENETRIMELEAMLKEATIVEKTTGSSEIRIGSSVVLDCEGKEMKFTIVGTNEVDPTKGLISGDSPFGSALMGRSKGDNVTIDVPAGKLKCVVTLVA
ncbi:MAG: transcription elongation factor GreA [Candidatus Moranbacteria bacterium]|nr:transcription elongation factor GreA [Candidatus Moranbacteria bacterium]NTW45684.1 transcription elongation factor GreA [Candidatus Moranbacteria bacterium]